MKTVYIPRYAYRRSQVGHGIGGIFRSLAKVFMPIAKTAGKAAIRLGKPLMKKVGRAAGKEALLMGLDTVNDIAQGESVKKSMTKNLKAGAKRSYQKTKNELTKRSKLMLEKALKVIDPAQKAQSGKRQQLRKSSKYKKTIFD